MRVIGQKTDRRTDPYHFWTDMVTRRVSPHREGGGKVRSLEIQIRNEIAELATIRDALDALGQELHVPSWTLIQLQVALDEIIGNAIRYSWPSGAIGEIRVRMTVGPDDVTLDIVDDGLAFDPLAIPDTVPDGPRTNPGGLGIHMVRRLVDGFTWRRINGHNHTTLTKKRIPGAAVEQE